MNIEHVAFQVHSPAEMAEWYVRQLGFTIKRKVDNPTQTHFLADDRGAMIEIYRQKHIRVPDYREADPLMLHLALVSADIEADRQRLLSAGATPCGEIADTPSGDRLAMLRDPWGFTLQLCQRAEPMV